MDVPSSPLAATITVEARETRPGYTVTLGFGSVGASWVGDRCIRQHAPRTRTVTASLVRRRGSAPPFYRCILRLTNHHHSPPLPDCRQRLASAPAAPLALYRLRCAVVRWRRTAGACVGENAQRSVSACCLGTRGCDPLTALRAYLKRYPAGPRGGEKPRFDPGLMPGSVPAWYARCRRWRTVRPLSPLRAMASTLSTSLIAPGTRRRIKPPASLTDRIRPRRPRVEPKATGQRAAPRVAAIGCADKRRSDATTLRIRARAPHSNPWAAGYRHPPRRAAESFA